MKKRLAIKMPLESILQWLVQNYQLPMHEKIAHIRIFNGLTQKELGDILKISFQQVQKYEKGGDKMKVEKITLIANALKIPTSFFFIDTNFLNCVNKFFCHGKQS